MKLFNRNGKPEGPDDLAAAVRLQAVTRRGMAEAVASPQSTLPKNPTEPQQAPRLFWAPEELQAA